MKYLFIVKFVCAICAAKSEELWETTNFSAVTEFEDMTDYYRSFVQKRSAMPPQPREPEEEWKKVQTRADICESIFGSDHFRALQIFWIKDELEARSRYNYPNAYSLRRVQIFVNGEPTVEWMFGCLVENRRSDQFHEYFVSAPYNVNLIDGGAANPITGRFVFAVNENDLSALQMVAIAEGAAIVSQRARLSAGLMYVFARWNEKPAETASLDPVCSLSPFDKLRLCSILFGSSEFKQAVFGIFEPTLDNVDQRCDKVTVSLPPIIWPVRRIYEEWVIGCISTTHDGNRTPYYVSRGKERNTIFAYLPGLSIQGVRLHNFFYNVSVVDQVYFSDTSSSVEALA